MDDKILVAVYGSLKEGYQNHRLLSDSELVGKGLTIPKYQMLSFGFFPGLIESLNSNNNVAVEVYKVNERTFKRLDNLEGYPTFYTRKLIKVQLDTEIVDAWIYILSNSNRNQLKLFPDDDGVLRW